ncbi:50S ribosomal protein L30 [Buchnera aphidicola]|uniref:Large ribosomal subunit protein uL30 n=1 Tax=Buchnera aphidicola subsp. Tuberolachnus salignus TaxID=98804 RepID=A0A170PC84_BUCTT|nr:50S ribosomal protein L30 [Buchnera aphidicola]CUR53303.1 50S ribosomal protein L30 [Buchnera aphidicola (Tuberolachnus salignus)]
MENTIKIMQVKSQIGRLKTHKATMIGLGLRKIGDIVVRKNTPSLWGMIKKVKYMIKILGGSKKCI